jgi:2-dehydro-3-deoxy-D-arabinonate dehydratase
MAPGGVFDEAEDHMLLTRHETTGGVRWALDGLSLGPHVTLQSLLEVPRAKLRSTLEALTTRDAPDGRLLAPVEDASEVWAAGVTYQRSREAREDESSVKDVYTRVYEADRPELFFKSVGWRVVGHGASVRVRRDSEWNVPEPELTLVVNSWGEIVGYCAGDDVSSRSIEGENPLYLPQAKVYDGACALGPGVLLASVDELRDLQISLAISRDGREVFSGETRTSAMKRSFEDLAGYLSRELYLRHGAFLMTGTGIVPPPEFTLRSGDVVRITIGALTLENPVA